MHNDFTKETSSSSNWALQESPVPLDTFINRGYTSGKFIKRTIRGGEFENEEIDFGFALPPVKDISSVGIGWRKKDVEPSSVEFSEASLSTSPFSELELPSSAFSKLELSPATLPSVEVFDASSGAWSIDKIFHVPDAPTNLAISVDELTATLNWDASDVTIEYYVYRDGSKIAETDALSFIDIGLDGGTEYTYYVTASNDIGESLASASIVIETEITIFFRADNPLSIDDEGSDITMFYSFVGQSHHLESSEVLDGDYSLRLFTPELASYTTMSNYHPNHPSEDFEEGVEYRFSCYSKSAVEGLSHTIKIMTLGNVTLVTSGYIFSTDWVETVLTVTAGLYYDGFRYRIDLFGAGNEAYFDKFSITKVT